MIAPHLRLQPGQQELTPGQEAEARRFADERIQAQLSNKPVDEQEAEAYLRDAYAVAGLPPPKCICWVDGPLHLVRVLALHDGEDSIYKHLRDSLSKPVMERLGNASLWRRVWDSVREPVRDHVQRRVWGVLCEVVWDQATEKVRQRKWVRVYSQFLADGPGSSRYEQMQKRVLDSVKAYYEADLLAFYRFFDEYLAPNALHALAHLSELVSGYWLGLERAMLVRRPRVLSRDASGHLHHETGKCIEYHDGWGFYAWHGVCVPGRVIQAPEALTRKDFLREPNVEVRRVIQERMGQRFVPALGGQIIDTGPRGTLYEVRLPADDPEQGARYVQVQDASTARRYFLRVPPTIQTAAEAVAWTFQFKVADYHPAEET